jgi:hypothetical protein
MDLEKSTHPPCQKVLYHNYLNLSRFKEKGWEASLDNEAFQPSRSVT